MPELLFEWDEEKARKNELKHDVSFELAKTVFNDPFAITVPDPIHSEGEERFVDIGRDSTGQLLVVWYTEHSGVVRIIGCRHASKSERRNYEDE